MVSLVPACKNNDLVVINEGINQLLDNAKLISLEEGLFLLILAKRNPKDDYIYLSEPIYESMICEKIHGIVILAQIVVWGFCGETIWTT